MAMQNRKWTTGHPVAEMCVCVPPGELWRYLEQLGIQQKVAHAQFGKPEDAIKTFIQRRWAQLGASLRCWGQCGCGVATLRPPVVGRGG